MNGRTNDPRGPRAAWRPHGGFTLTELLVVIAIIMVAASLAVVGFATITRGRNVGSAAYGVHGMINQARSYATAHNVQTVVMFYTSPEPRVAVYWHPNPPYTFEPATFDLADLQGPISKPYYLRTGVQFVRAPDPVSQLAYIANTDRIVDLSAAANYYNLLVFNPTGGMQSTARLGTNNVQIALVARRQNLYKAVTVLSASGLPYVEEAR